MKPRQIPIALALCAALASFAPSGMAQQEQPPPETHDIRLEHADRYRYDEKTHQVELAGDVVLHHEDGTLRCAKITFDTETKKGEATGNPTFTDPENTVTGDALFIDFKARVAGFRGKVKLVRQPEKKPEPEKKQPEKQPEPEAQPAEGQKKLEEYRQQKTTISADEIQYYYKEKRVVADGSVKAEQEKRTAWGDQAVYTDSDELLVITGNVRLETSGGESFRSQKVTISLKENWVEAQGNIESRFKISEE
jgi:lipopolysaccharide assembly outer membrane protein LptD (OstA)